MIYFDSLEIDPSIILLSRRYKNLLVHPPEKYFRKRDALYEKNGESKASCSIMILSFTQMHHIVCHLNEDKHYRANCID